MTVVGEVFMKVSPDADQFGTETENAVTTKMPGPIKKIAGLMAGAFAVQGATTFFKEAVAGASDLGESLSKNQVVFGSASKEVLAFAKNSATAFGQTEAQALGATGTFGNLLRAVGLTEQESAKLSTGMVGLASDLASFNNTSVDDALEALRSGLVGETEPLKRFGVNMNEATLKAKAMQLGLTDGKGVLDANTKAQAAYALIMEQTTLAQGDFARTSGGLANQQRILSAQWGNMKAQIGTALIPAVTAVVSALNGMIPTVAAVGSAIADGLGSALSGIGSLVKPAIDTLTDFGKVVGPAVLDGIASGFGAVADVVGPLIETLGKGLGGAIGDVVGDLQDIGEAIGSGGVANQFRVFNATWDDFISTTGQTGVLKGLRGVLDTVLEGARNLVGFVADHADVFIRFAFPSVLAVDALRKVLVEGDPSIPEVLVIIRDNVDLATAAFQRQSDVILPLTAAAGSFVTAFLAYNQVTKTINTVQTAFNLLGPAVSASLAPLLANPAVLIVAGIVALGVAAFVAYKKIEPFRNAVDAVARTVRDVAVEAFEVGRVAVQRLAEVFSTVGTVIADAFSSVGGAVSGAIGPIQEALGPLGRFLRDDLGATFQAGGELIVAVLERIRAIAGPVVKATIIVLGGLAKVVGTVLTGAFQAAAPVVEAALRVMSTVLTNLGKVAIPVFTLAVKTLSTVVQVSFNAISQIVQTTLAIIRGTLQVFTGIFSGDFGKIWEGLVTIVKAPLEGLVNFIRSSFGVIVDYLAGLPAQLIEIATTWWTGVIDTTVTALGSLPDIVRGQLAGLLTVVGELPGQLLSMAGAMAEGFVGMLAGMLPAGQEVVEDTMGTLVGFLGELPGKILGLAGALTSAVTTWFTDAFSSAYTAASGYVTNTVFPWLVGLPGEIVTQLGDALGVLVDWGSDLISGLLTGATDFFRVDVMLWFSHVTETIKDQIAKNPLTVLLQMGRDIIQGLWNGIKEIWNKLTGWIADAASHLPGFIKGPLGIGSPSKVFHGLGTDTAQGFYIGLQEGWSKVETLAGDSASGLSTALQDGLQEGLGGVADYVKQTTEGIGVDIDKVFAGLMGSVLSKALEPAIGAAATRLMDTTLIEQAAQQLQALSTEALHQLLNIKPDSIKGITFSDADGKDRLAQIAADTYGQAFSKTLNDAVSPAIGAAVARIQVTTLVEELAQALQQNVGDAIAGVVATARGQAAASVVRSGAAGSSAPAGQANLSVSVYDGRSNLTDKGLAEWIQRTGALKPGGYKP